MKYLFVGFFVLTVKLTFSQDFNYAFQKSESTYSEIPDSTVVFSNDDFDQSKKIPIGFEFNFAGITIDSLNIKSTGLFSFDDGYRYNFMFFNKNFLFSSKTDSLTSISSLVENENNISVLKIQFKNMLYTLNGSNVYLSFQIWLKQYSNKIEFHMGPKMGSEIVDACMFGLINTNNTSVNNIGYLLSGMPEDPIPSLIPPNGQLVYLNHFPLSNTVYTFSPNTF